MRVNSSNFALEKEFYMTEPKLIQIDIDAVLRSRLPRHYRYIPRFVIRGLEKMVCQDQLNEMLRVNRGRRDADFCRGVLQHLDITYTVEGAENLPDDPRCLIVSNHPLGGLDGMMLIDYVQRRYPGEKVKFLVNDLLMAIEPLGGVFLPVNKHGRQSRDASALVNESFEGSGPIIIFPAGLVSRKGRKGVIADLEWQKSFVNKAIEYRRPVIPLFFSGQNSKFFYNFAKLRTRLGLKFNIEMIRLPREVFRSKGQSYSLKIGAPIAWSELKGGSKARLQAEEIRAKVYELGDINI